jgi:hypothetical protein
MCPIVKGARASRKTCIGQINKLARPARPTASKAKSGRARSLGQPSSWAPGHREPVPRPCLACASSRLDRALSRRIGWAIRQSVYRKQIVAGIDNPGLAATVQFTDVAGDHLHGRGGEAPELPRAARVEACVNRTAKRADCAPASRRPRAVKRKPRWRMDTTEAALGASQPAPAAPVRPAHLPHRMQAPAEEPVAARLADEKVARMLDDAALVHAGGLHIGDGLGCAGLGRRWG